MAATRDSASELLDPAVLARIRGMELLARTVVEGFVLGLHRDRPSAASAWSSPNTVRTSQAMTSSTSTGACTRAPTAITSSSTRRRPTSAATSTLLDASASMGGGEGDRQKLLYGKRLAGCLAYFMTRQRDAVGMTIFDATVRQALPARLRHSHLQRILGELDSCRGRRQDHPRRAPPPRPPKSSTARA